MSDVLMDVLARPRDGYSVTWEWGQPDENGWYTPTFTEHALPVVRAAVIAGPIAKEDVEDLYGGVAPEGRDVL